MERLRLLLSVLLASHFSVVSRNGIACDVRPTVRDDESLEFRVRGFTRSLLPFCLGVAFIITAIGLAGSFGWKFTTFDLVMLFGGLVGLLIGVYRFLLTDTIVIALPALSWSAKRTVAGATVTARSGEPDELQIVHGGSTYRGLRNAQGEAVVLVAGSMKVLLYSDCREPDADGYLASLPEQLVDRIAIHERLISVTHA